MGKFFRKLFRTFSLIQKVFFSLIFWIIVILVLVGIFYDGTPKVREGEVLVVAPSGYIVEEYSSSPYQRQVDNYRGDPPGETLLSDLSWVLEKSASDKRIVSVLLDLSGFAGAGPAVLESFRNSLDKFKESGKPLYAYAPFLEQSGLYLASTADETVLDPMGEVFIRGYGSYRSYMKEGLDKWGITPHIYRAGENKDYVTPYLYSEMPDREKSALRTYLDDLWQSWLESTARSLGKNPGDLQYYSDNYGSLLISSGLSSAKLAVQRGLAQKIMNYDDFNQLMISRVGLDESGYGFSQSYWTDYLAREKGRDSLLPGNKIGLLVLSGEILWGEGDWSRMGSYQVNLVLDQILEDSDISALVIRVDSPGGSAMGAEEIRRKLEKFHDYGIPLFVSMGNYAASGGYWISSEADEIWAENTTLTGSIGVFSYFFTAENFLKENLGVTVDGYGTSALADTYSLGRDTSSETDKMLQAGVNQVYSQFLNLVSLKRGIPLARLEEIAGGRVWTGRQAKERGLVDGIGNLADVLDRAAETAQLGSDYQVKVFDDNRLTRYGSGLSLLPSISSFFNWPPLIRQAVELPALPEDNPFGDPRRINAWSSYETLQ